ncbi:MAG TPA: carboxypeptidase regulatory-like domain-containing protein, partial [Armatimonadetes bacterium]|nr:carboxypeptidase regulatory-like domain-containing protein [Armatimonadota bacterium]
MAGTNYLRCVIGSDSDLRASVTWIAMRGGVALLIVFCLLITPACKSKRRKLGFTGSGRITGVVLDEEGVPVPKAVVYVEGLMQVALTDEKGRYTLTGLPAGTFTIVASLPGYRKAVRSNVRVRKKKTTQGVDLTLVRDPTYEPDMVRFLEVYPPEGARLESGKPLTLRGRIQYRLRNARWGTIYIFLLNEKGREVLPTNLSRISAMRGERIVPFARHILVPPNLGGRVWLVAALFITDERSAAAADTVAYSVGPARDEVTFISSEPPFGTRLYAGEQVKLKVRVSYFLESEKEAILHVQVLGGTQSGRYSIVLAERKVDVQATPARAQTLEFEFECTPAEHMPAIKLRGVLIDKDTSNPIAAAWSPRFIIITPRSNSNRAKQS